LFCGLRYATTKQSTTKPQLLAALEIIELPMKYEIIFFRLFLLVLCSSFVFCGGYTLYSLNEENDWQKLVSSAHDKLNESALACESDRSSLKCEFAEMWQESFDSSLTKRDEYSSKAEIFGHLTYFLPLLSVYLFYSLRWVILGKLRPVIIGKKSQK
jgi:hypothetical protein